MKLIETVHDYGVVLDGLWGRNRKTKREYFNFLMDQPNELTLEEVQDKLIQFMNKIGLKKGTATVKVYTVQKTTEVIDGVKFQSKMLNPMDYKIIDKLHVI